MSTNSNIIVKVKKSDISSIALFDAKKLDVPEKSWDENNNGIINGNEKPVEITNEYIGIYCHWDGYLAGVGYALKEYFNTYEKALNLVLGGDLSYIDDDGNIMRYATRDGEDWDYIAPEQSDDPISLANQEYNYLFEDGKWKWLNDDGEWKEF